MICSFCKKSYTHTNIRYRSSALKNHQSRCSQNPNKVLQKAKNPEDVRKKLSEKSREFYSKEENRKKHSLIMKKAVMDYPESYSDKNIVGRSKHFTIDGIRYNSSWEYEVSKYLTENNIKWQRSKLIPEKYLWNNSWHLYFPDFYLDEYDCYIEVKGYETERDRQKWKYSSKKVVVIKQKEIDLIRKRLYDIREMVGMTNEESCGS